MKTITISLFVFFAAAAIPAQAKTVVLDGVHPQAKVQSMCKRYGGTFSASRTGHGCSKAGYGRVWCSKSGRCIARLNENFKIAQR